MILPIYAYGDPVLKKKASPIEKDHPGLKELIANMYETMYASHGVGLAAPQIGLSLRLFVTDGSPFEEDEVKDFKQVFINPQIVEETGDPWKFNEGCLSIPHVREDVSRKKTVLIEYYDEDWNFRKEYFSGLAARIIQHEYDHIEGVLFTDRISPLRRRLLNKRLSDISSGNVKVDYKMRFPSQR
ncbi:MAG: peptide deformylase [Bacteroidia bacterium]|nr:peptide deformylase [Bacteroidia bacterium]MBP7269040.1 peptide deformylase [Bacteroidia bacterium]MBP7772259.1 peptide deformylase [Bacteroidia bacterium]